MSIVKLLHRLMNGTSSAFKMKFRPDVTIHIFFAGTVVGINCKCKWWQTLIAPFNTDAAKNVVYQVVKIWMEVTLL